MLDRADELLSSVSGAPPAGKEVLFQKMLSTAQQPGQPYFENPNPTWGSPITVTAWVIKDPRSPILEALRRELLQLGQEDVIDAVFYVSERENIRKNLGFSGLLRTGRFTHETERYNVLRVRPSSLVHGVPAFYKVLTAKAAGTIAELGT